jgi:hypothetical protein
VANSLLTPQIIARRALELYLNNLSFVRRINKDFQSDFDGTYNGNKPGNTMLIRKPVQFTSALGRVAFIQDVTEANTALAITQQNHVAFQFTSADFALTIDQFQKRYLDNAMSALANGVDAYCFNLAVQGTANATGTPGTTPNSLTPFVNAMAKLDKLAVPRANRAVIMDPLTNASLVDNLKGLFNPGRTISDQYLSGEVSGGTLGMTWDMDQNAPTQVYGPQGGTPVVNGANQVGSSLVTNGWTAAAALRLNAGDVFTIAGVFAVNPMNKMSTGQLQQFVVTANVSSDGTGAATIPISPAIVATGSYQNVTNSPANGSALTVAAAAGTQSPQNLVFNPDAYTFASVALETPGGVDMSYQAKDPDSGVRMRFVRDYDPVNDVFLSRFDCVYGFAVTRPEAGVRVQA